MSVATREEVRDYTIAALKAAAGVSALVSDRVYDERHADYPPDASHPALIVYTPGTTATPRDTTETYWEVEDQLVIQGLLSRSSGESDGDLSGAADVLEAAVRSALIPSSAWRNLCDIESVRRWRLDRTAGTGTDRHRMAFKLTLALQRPDEQEEEDSELTLDEILQNLHPKDESDESVPTDPTSSYLNT